MHNTTDTSVALRGFKELCLAEGLLQSSVGRSGDDISSGIDDDGTLLRFLRARDYNIEKAFQQYKATRTWRDTNELLDLYDSIDIDDYEETRKLVRELLYTHWTGRTDRDGSPLCLFEVGQLTPKVMAAYNKACSENTSQSSSSESEAMLRLFCTYEYLIRFVMPLCTDSLPEQDLGRFVTEATCIVDLSGVSFIQLWRLRGHMQAASTLATSYYPETLGKTFIIGAPSFFPTVWGWISTWFDQRTVSKIHVVPQGREYEYLSKAIDPINISQKYGGNFNFEFGMLPNMNTKMREKVVWLNLKNDRNKQDLLRGPHRWVRCQDGRRLVAAVGTSNGIPRY